MNTDTRQVLTLSMVFSLMSATPGQVVANGESGIRTLQNIHVESGNFAHFQPTVPFENPDACGSSNVAIIPSTDPSYKDQMAIALTAFTAGKQVSFWFMGCYNTPWGFTAPRIYSITIQ